MICELSTVRRTQKYLRSKFGDVEDETLDDADEEEQTRVVWGKKSDMYGADVIEVCLCTTAVLNYFVLNIRY